MQVKKNNKERNQAQLHFWFLFWGLQPHCQPVPQGFGLVREANVTSVPGSRLLVCAVLGKGERGVSTRCLGDFWWSSRGSFLTGHSCRGQSRQLQAAEGGCRWQEHRCS